jgi:Ala-tRNA(Pro) deacylase
MDEKTVLDLLAAQGIAYQLFKHQPVFTTADKPILIDSGDLDTIPGIHSKTLLLKSKETFFLVSVAEDKRVDLKALSAVLGCARFSFATAAELLELLKLTPGSVTPFGLLFDESKRVLFVLDEDFMQGPAVLFHPLRNDMTISIAPDDFVACMHTIGHAPRIIRIPTKA